MYLAMNSPVRSSVASSGVESKQNLYSKTYTVRYLPLRAGHGRAVSMGVDALTSERFGLGVRYWPKYPAASSGFCSSA